jgi:hypothetical protein
MALFLGFSRLFTAEAEKALAQNSPPRVLIIGA